MSNGGHFEKVIVGVRLRNFIESDDEFVLPSEPLWTAENNCIIQNQASLSSTNTPFNSSRPLNQNDTNNKKNLLSFSFDKTFSPKTNNQQVHETLMKGSIESVLSGISFCVLAYGQTGSGKTHSIFGTPSDSGLLPLTVDALFQTIEQRLNDNPSLSFSVTCSYLEVYCEQVLDLLASDTPKNTPLDKTTLKYLKVKERGDSFFVEGLTSIPVASKREIVALIGEGESRRRNGATNFNVRSSRSHVVLTLAVESYDSSDGCRVCRRGYLRFVDLAGNEPYSASRGLEKEREQKGKLINQSLFYLSEVVHQLASGSRKKGEDGDSGERVAEDQKRRDLEEEEEKGEEKRLGGSKRTNVSFSPPLSPGTAASEAREKEMSSSIAQRYIPYRNSKLTRILADSLGKNGRLVLLVTLHPSAKFAEQSLVSLRFAAKARAIEALVKPSFVPEDQSEITRCRVEISQLKSHIVHLQYIIDELGEVKSNRRFFPRDADVFTEQGEGEQREEKVATGGVEDIEEIWRSGDEKVRENSVGGHSKGLRKRQERSSLENERALSADDMALTEAHHLKSVLTRKLMSLSQSAFQQHLTQSFLEEIERRNKREGSETKTQAQQEDVGEEVTEVREAIVELTLPEKENLEEKLHDQDISADMAFEKHSSAPPRVRNASSRPDESEESKPVALASIFPTSYYEESVGDSFLAETSGMRDKSKAHVLEEDCQRLPHALQLGLLHLKLVYGDFVANAAQSEGRFPNVLLESLRLAMESLKDTVCATWGDWEKRVEGLVHVNRVLRQQVQNFISKADWPERQKQIGLEAESSGKESLLCQVRAGSLLGENETYIQGTRQRPKGVDRGRAETSHLDEISETEESPWIVEEKMRLENPNKNGEARVAYSPEGQASSSYEESPRSCEAKDYYSGVLPSEKQSDWSRVFAYTVFDEVDQAQVEYSTERHFRPDPYLHTTQYVKSENIPPEQPLAFTAAKECSRQAIEARAKSQKHVDPLGTASLKKEKKKRKIQKMLLKILEQMDSESSEESNGVDLSQAVRRVMNEALKNEIHNETYQELAFRSSQESKVEKEGKKAKELSFDSPCSILKGEEVLEAEHSDYSYPQVRHEASNEPWAPQEEEKSCPISLVFSSKQNEEKGQISHSSILSCSNNNVDVVQPPSSNPPLSEHEKVRFAKKETEKIFKKANQCDRENLEDDGRSIAELDELINEKTIIRKEDIAPLSISAPSYQNYPDLERNKEKGVPHQQSALHHTIHEVPVAFPSKILHPRDSAERQTLHLAYGFESPYSSLISLSPLDPPREAPQGTALKPRQRLNEHIHKSEKQFLHSGVAQSLTSSPEDHAKEKKKPSEDSMSRSVEGHARIAPKVPQLRSSKTDLPHSSIRPERVEDCFIPVERSIGEETDRRYLPKITNHSIMEALDKAESLLFNLADTLSGIKIDNRSHVVIDTAQADHPNTKGAQWKDKHLQDRHNHLEARGHLEEKTSATGGREEKSLERKNRAAGKNNSLEYLVEESDATNEKCFYSSSLAEELSTPVETYMSFKKEATISDISCSIRPRSPLIKTEVNPTSKVGSTQSLQKTQDPYIISLDLGFQHFTRKERTAEAVDKKESSEREEDAQRKAALLSGKVSHKLESHFGSRKSITPSKKEGLLNSERFGRVGHDNEFGKGVGSVRRIGGIMTKEDLLTSAKKSIDVRGGSFGENKLSVVHSKVDTGIGRKVASRGKREESSNVKRGTSRPSLQGAYLAYPYQDLKKKGSVPERGMDTSRGRMQRKQAREKDERMGVGGRAVWSTEGRRMAADSVGCMYPSSVCYCMSEERCPLCLRGREEDGPKVSRMAPYFSPMKKNKGVVGNEDGGKRKTLGTLKERNMIVKGGKESEGVSGSGLGQSVVVKEKDNGTGRNIPYGYLQLNVPLLK